MIMNTKKIRIAVTGISGRMGCNILKAILQQNNICLGAALSYKDISLLGIDVGKFLGIDDIGIMINNCLTKVINDFDILIDFTTPKGTLKHLEICTKFNKKMVIGTTGFNESAKKLIYSASKNISIVLSENFSIGINLLLNLVDIAAKTIGNNTDIDILESHHRYKLDAPSGTSLLIGNTIANSMGWKFKDHAIYNRNNYIGKRKDKEISFAVIRAGDIVGEHSIYFTNNEECIEIRHKALNRMIFAHGALKAANWLINQNVGFFNMNDVLFK